MDKTILKEALDLAYELEALMEMGVTRDPLPERIAALIDERSQELNRKLDEALGRRIDDEKASEEEVSVLSVPDSEAEAEEEEEEAEAEAEAEAEEEHDEVDDYPEEEAGDDYDAEYEEEEEEAEAVREDAVEERERVTGKISRPNPSAPRKDIRRCFSVNDRFRFRRELFSNNADEYADALNMVEAMRGYDEAEEYFYDDLGWDPENGDVQQFMGIIADYFGK